MQINNMKMLIKLKKKFYIFINIIKKYNTKKKNSKRKSHTHSDEKSGKVCLANTPQDDRTPVCNNN
jgi:hypothetical protein